MEDPVYNVLFLCTGNSSRSIMAEALLNQLGSGHFRAYSAGVRPKSDLNPIALQVINDAGLSTEGLRCKSWDEFTRPGALEMDFVFTVSDVAAGETCPALPGSPITAHWGIEDPTTVQGTDLEKEAAFVAAFRYLRNRIAAFASLPLESIDQISLRSKLNEIGDMDGTALRAQPA
jgi:protein-tyrosine-phosphatase